MENVCIISVVTQVNKVSCFSCPHTHTHTQKIDDRIQEISAYLKSSSLASQDGAQVCCQINVAFLFSSYLILSFFFLSFFVVCLCVLWGGIMSQSQSPLDLHKELLELDVLADKTFAKNSRAIAHVYFQLLNIALEKVI